MNVIQEESLWESKLIFEIKKIPPEWQSHP